MISTTVKANSTYLKFSQSKSASLARYVCVYKEYDSVNLHGGGYNYKDNKLKNRNRIGGHNAKVKNVIIDGDTGFIISRLQWI